MRASQPMGVDAEPLPAATSDSTRLMWRSKSPLRMRHDAPRDGHLARGQARAVERNHGGRAAAHELAVRARRDLVHVGVLVREDVARGGHARRQARVALAQERHDLVAHEGAQVAGVRVRAVLAPHDAAHAEQVAQLLVRAVQQRPHDAVAPPRYGREARGPAAADRVHEEGLRAVVGRVGREDPRGGARHVDLAAQAVGELRRLAVAHLAADVLHVGARLLA